MPRFLLSFFLVGSFCASVFAQSPLSKPERKDPGAAGIGRFIPAIPLPDSAGALRTWREGQGARATVIALFSATCPLSRRFGPEIAAFEAAWRGAGVRVVLVDVGGSEDAQEAKEFAAAMGLSGLLLRDPSLQFAGAVGLSTTTEVLLVDPTGTLLYRGAFSDQYGADHALEAPRKAYLELAVRDVLAERKVAISATHAPGCALELPVAQAEQSGEKTYYREIARLVDRHCIECHRQDGVAPFSLQSYEEVARRASMISTVIDEGRMPPFFAAEELAEAAPSRFLHAARVSPAERQALREWVAAGKPRGDPADAPAERTFAAGGWAIGTPDAVIQVPDAIEIPARGVLPYQHIAVRTGFTEDRWVRAMQVLPSDRSVVHHALIFVVPEGQLRGGRVRLRDLAEEGKGFFAAYVPGQETVIYPPGYAKRLPANSALIFQIHYTPNGVATEDRMRLGLCFAAEAPQHLVRTAGLMKRDLLIPAEAAAHEEQTSVLMPDDVVLLAFLPHMHVRGKSFRYDLERKDGSRETLLHIPQYDFDWQLRYELAEPLPLARGDRLHLSARFDNSAGNPNNPDPSRAVRWGPMTDDEMMIGYIEYYRKKEDPRQPDELEAAAEPLPTIPRATLERLFRRFDRNEDGRLSKTELPARFQSRFATLDADGDGQLTREELQKLAR